MSLQIILGHSRINANEALVLVLNLGTDESVNLSNL